VENGLTDEILDKVQDTQARDLIKQLVVREPTKRLGSNGGFA
jgi:hypothetical protein